MKRIQPSEFVTTAKYQRSINGRAFDLTVHFTFFGEVLLVENHFLNLPEAAQQLSLGKDIKKVLSKLNTHIELLNYFVPMATSGLLKSEEWNVFYQEAQALKNNIPELGELVPEKSVGDDWLKAFYQQLRLTRRAETFPYLRKLARDVEQWNVTNIRNIAFFKVKLAKPILLKVAPVVENQQILNAIFETLEFFPSLEVKDLLIQQIKNFKSPSTHLSALKGLTFYEGRDLYLALLQYYVDYPQLIGKPLEYYMTCLGNYHTDRARAILKEILAGQSRSAGNQAFALLRKQGMTDEAFNRVLRPVFDERPSVNHLENVLNLYRKLDKEKYWPSPDEVIDLLLWANLKRPTTRLNYFIPDYLRGRISPRSYRRLLDLVKHPNAGVRNGAMTQITTIGEEEHLKSIIDLLDDSDATMINQALIAIKGMAQKNYNISIAMPKVFEKIQGNNLLVKLEALRLLEVWLPDNPDEKALPFILLEKDSLQDNVRVLVAKILVAFDDDKAIQSLKKLAKDSNKLVANAAEKSINKIEDRKKYPLREWFKQQIKKAFG